LPKNSHPGFEKYLVEVIPYVFGRNQNSNPPTRGRDSSDRIESGISRTKLAGNLEGLRAFADTQEARDGGSQQERKDQENHHELDYRENVLNVFAPRHSRKSHETNKPQRRRHRQ
jgi:hypothetical protein